MTSRLVLACLALAAAGAFAPLEAHDASLARMRPAAETAQQTSPLVRVQTHRKSITTRRTSPEASTTPAGQAQSNGEVLFGAQDVGFLVDRDIIPVGPEIGKFDRVRVRVLRNDIFISDLTAVFENGETETLLKDTQINSDRKTEWIPLKHSGFIKEIRVVYRAKPVETRWALMIALVLVALGALGTFPTFFEAFASE